MSLQLVANHLAQKGRGPDSTLVHMSNREVAGLNALAQKHGGQLSVNPETGLPEAGFLDNILPAVAGAGISYFSGGTIDPMMAAGIVGGISALDSKDLSKGLVAGLGAYGGAGMVGGLAGLGAAGADTAAMAAPEYQAAVGTGAGNFASHPIDSLSTLGGGSALKGSLPILAGLAPAAADMMDSPDEEDTPPEQKKGYIRKYAFDPVTGQYKQVGAYEAGGDPNKDVTSEAGTAGSYGGVREPEYQQPKGMAEGGTASDSERIYDYLMGRGPNPMQFTHTSSPQVDYTPYMPKPITPTTQILEPVYDQYGNRSGGSQSQEQRDQREADLDRMDDYLGMTMRDYWNLSEGERANVDADAAERSPIRAGIINTAKTIGTLLMPGTLAMKAYNAFTGPTNSVGRVNSGYSAPPVTPNVDPQTFGGYYAGVTPNPYSMGPGTPGFNDPNTKPQNIGSVPTSDGNTEAAARAEAIARIAGEMPNTPPPGSEPQRNNNGGNRSKDPGPSNDPSPSDGGDTSGGYADSARFAGGPSNAHGGYLQHGQFDQRMAHGGIANLAQGYDSGGMTLPMKAQPIKNLGSMHPKSLQAAYDLAVATNDVAGTRKYQNELGLREKFKSPQIYADGGETGQYNLGSYSDGGRLLKGPGDGVSDDIPATIGNGQPARLANGEFVIPARIVSELGNGSTDAGARELYKMMDRIQAGRKKTVGKDQVAKNSKSARHLPA
ncbi:hypothetical protein UFOVP1276_52 [uncultured Caudovirales phage]|uniref:Uncharacterized protein n=1 Tax=uncultured Caudovirales phage TaxID=2100421 RepID=A0A6J5PKZ4_9CAUD|nr:hypothetical protein UFOVP875_83 [uncultured Caudovirales phage]CAB4195117.1 hypothetical protein UFOVP1276_52 [uncultured Caudovirales phage]CAB4205043.1 hypothetical protein UFOVP1403_14 [uncultured Caudovirales phage]CAB5238149.1 hypothetical protein UFOVP1507_85 [uncultured Caudovirales phage]